MIMVPRTSIQKMASKSLLCYALLAWVGFACVGGKILVPFVCENNIPEMEIDTAHLTISNDINSDVSLILSMQTTECYTCNMITQKTILKDMNCTVLVNTHWPMRVEIQVFDVENGNSNKTDPSCSEANLTTSFMEGGEYVIYIRLNKEPDEKVMCSNVIPMNDPPDSNIPIYVAVGIGVSLSLFWILMKYLYRRGILHRLLYFWSTEGMMVNRYTSQDLGTPTNINAGDDQQNNKDDKKKERLKSLDAFRGISILVMIFVNYRGGKYWFFNHSVWNGVTVADLVFPWFVFIMGTAMVYSFQGQLRRNTTKKMIFWKIFKRSCKLFLLGIFINSGDSRTGVVMEQFRIPGVLQRFAGTYLIVATVHLFFAKTADENQYRWWAPVRDILDYWPEWIINLSFVALHTGFTFALPVPNCPTGYLGPGGLAEGGNYANCTGGAAGYIDRMIFGESHLYQKPTAKVVYQTVVPHDPEGLLGTLTSCFICFLGLQAGKILFVYKDWVKRIKRFAIWGIILGIIAAILCKGSKNDGWIPVCKNLWSLSYVLAMASFAFVLLMFCYLTIDVWKIWSGAPFYYPGMNAIVLYVGHEVFSHRIPIYFHITKTHGGELALSIWGAAFWFIVSAYMYHAGIFVNV